MGKGQHFLLRYAAFWLAPLALVIALLMAEGVLRLFPQLLPEEAQIKRLWQLQTPSSSIGDPYLGSVYPPHHKTEVKSLDFRFAVESDEHGFRNPPPWPEQADIVVVGDSLAYGWGVEREAAWFSLLDERLPESRIITLGMPGTVPQQYFRYLTRFGIGLKPKLVIFAIFPGNDVAEAETFDRWLAAGSPGNFSEWRFFEGRVPDRRVRFPNNSYLALFLQGLKKNLSQKYASKTITLADGERLQLAPAIYMKAFERNDPLDPGFQSIVAATVAAGDLAKEHGSEFLVLLFPTKEGVYLPLHGEPFPTLTQPLQEVLEDEGITCLSLIQEFRTQAVAGKKLYFEIDGHPNELGNRVIADVLAEYLKNKLP